MKLLDWIDLFRKGSAVANKAAWANGGNVAALLAPFMLALAKLAGDYGYFIKLDIEQAMSIASGISAVVLFITHNISNKHAGVLPSKLDAEVLQPAPAAKESEVQPVLDSNNKQTAQDGSYLG